MLTFAQFVFRCLLLRDPRKTFELIQVSLLAFFFHLFDTRSQCRLRELPAASRHLFLATVRFRPFSSSRLLMYAVLEGYLFSPLTVGPVPWFFSCHLLDDSQVNGLLFKDGTVSLSKFVHRAWASRTLPMISAGPWV